MKCLTQTCVLILFISLMQITLSEKSLSSNSNSSLYSKYMSYDTVIKPHKIGVSIPGKENFNSINNNDKSDETVFLLKNESKVNKSNESNENEFQTVLKDVKFIDPEIRQNPNTDIKNSNNNNDFFKNQKYFESPILRSNASSNENNINLSKLNSNNLNNSSQINKSNMPNYNNNYINNTKKQLKDLSFEGKINSQANNNINEETASLIDEIKQMREENKSNINTLKETINQLKDSTNELKKFQQDILNGGLLHSSEKKDNAEEHKSNKSRKSKKSKKHLKKEKKVEEEDEDEESNEKDNEELVRFIEKKIDRYQEDEDLDERECIGDCSNLE